MTNETEAPERIWVTWPQPNSTGLAFSCQARPPARRTEYTHADLCDAQAARIAELEERNTALGEAVAYATQRIAELEAGEAEATRLMLGSQKRMRQYKARAEAAEAKLAKAEWLLVDAMVQLREGKIKTRKNRADLIEAFLKAPRGE